jgi:phosphoserine aminotransferase
MERVYNFSAGPSTLPLEVLQKAQESLLCYGNSGMSIMEMSHRSADFEAVRAGAESALRQLMNIPDNYKVLFMHGGATGQFAAVPLNLLNGSGKADYVLSGVFSKKASVEAKKYGDIAIAASSAGANFAFIPATTRESFRPDADYVHICFNNTIFGTRFPYIPDTGDIPLVADFSSCIASEPIDVSKFGVIYAGAQKNFGIAGMAVVIIREDLIGHARETTPAILNYQLAAENDSMYNTPPCWSIYITKLVCEWLLENGGLEAAKKRNEEKASLLYDYLDHQDFYIAPVDAPSRSIMNVVFRTQDAELDKLFVSEAAKAGLKSLKGHKAVGGIRASIYNAMPKAGVEKLVAFMKQFAADHSQK